jgi:SSS family solute:Na+ symporter
MTTNTPALSAPDLFIILAYFAGLAWLSLRCAKHHDSTDAFFLGKRRLPGWAVGLSLVGTSISSITFLAYPADSFKTTWIRFLPNLMLPLAILIAAFAIMPRFRAAGTTTAYEFLAKHFGNGIRRYAAIVFIVGQVLRISTILYLISILIQQLTGLSPTVSIFLCGGFVVAYTLIGGLEAVVWTDVVQTVVLALGGVVCFAMICQALPNGLLDVVQNAWGADKLSFDKMTPEGVAPLSWHLNFSDKTISLLLMLGLVNWLVEYSGNQNTVQRFCACRSTKEARKALWICAATSLPIWAFYLLLGTALWVFYQTFPDAHAQAVLAGTASAETILPHFILSVLPIGLTGLVIAAAISAAMSSLDSSLNAVSAVGLTDLSPQAFSHQPMAAKLRWARLLTLGTGTIMMLGALSLHHLEIQTLKDLLIILTSVASGGLFGLFAAALWTRRGSPGSVWCGITLCALFTGWTVISERTGLPDAWQYPFDLYYTAIFTNLLMFITVVSRPRHRATAPRKTFAKSLDYSH